MIDTSVSRWREIYEQRGPGELSWHEPLPQTSLELIADAQLPLTAGVIDVGGGASLLAGELLAAGYSDITVADISAIAMEEARSRLGTPSDRIAWVEADLRDHDFGRPFDLWHDRAVFHFMVEASDREGYIGTLRRSLLPGGHLILATFGPAGPTACSGLPVQRYSATSLADTLGADFKLLSYRLEEHRTPSGASQQFLYAHLRRGA